MEEKSVFDERAMDWDNPRRKQLAVNIASAIKDKMKFTKDMTVMDFGAGTGLLTLELHSLVKDITAVDNSGEMLNQLEQKINSDGNLKNIKTALLDIKKENFKESSYDVIVSSMALHHIKDIKGLVLKFYSALKTGGSIALADLEKENGDFHEDNRSVEHFGFEKKSIETIFSSSGFIDIEVNEIYKIARNSGKEYPVLLFTARKI